MANQDPLKHPTFDKDALEKQIESLTGTGKIETKISEANQTSSRSLWLGTILILLSLVACCWVGYYARCQEKNGVDQSCVEKCICKDNKAILECNCYCNKYDASVYGFIILIALGLIGGIILLRSYKTALAKVSSYQNELLIIRDIQLAWQISKALPEWVIKEPGNKKIEEKFDKDGKVTEKKDNQREVDYAYPQQRAHQQIIETLLGRKPQ